MVKWFDALCHNADPKRKVVEREPLMIGPLNVKAKVIGPLIKAPSPLSRSQSPGSYNARGSRLRPTGRLSAGGGIYDTL